MSPTPKDTALAKKTERKAARKDSGRDGSDASISQDHHQKLGELPGGSGRDDTPRSHFWPSELGSTLKSARAGGWSFQPPQETNTALCCGKQTLPKGVAVNANYLWPPDFISGVRGGVPPLSNCKHKPTI